MLLSAPVYLAVLYIFSSTSTSISIEFETIYNLNLKSSNFCSYLGSYYYGLLITSGLTICTWCGNIVKSFIRYKLSLTPNSSPTALFIWQFTIVFFYYIYLRNFEAFSVPTIYTCNCEFWQRMRILLFYLQYHAVYLEKIFLELVIVHFLR